MFTFGILLLHSMSSCHETKGVPVHFLPLLVGDPQSQVDGRAVSMQPDVFYMLDILYLPIVYICVYLYIYIYIYYIYIYTCIV